MPHPLLVYTSMLHKIRGSSRPPQPSTVHCRSSDGEEPRLEEPSTIILELLDIYLQSVKCCRSQSDSNLLRYRINTCKLPPAIGSSWSIPYSVTMNLKFVVITRVFMFRNAAGCTHWFYSEDLTYFIWCLLLSNCPGQEAERNPPTLSESTSYGLAFCFHKLLGACPSGKEWLVFTALPCFCSHAPDARR